MPVIDFFPRDYDQMARKVAATTYDRQAVERFCAEVDKIMKQRAIKRPMEMAQACVQERAKLLVAFNKAGWARVPSDPQKFILVDPKGCVITDLDGKPIPPHFAAILKSTVPNTRGFIKASFASGLPSVEGNIPHFYLDTTNNVTIGIGHKVEGESDALAIHRKFGFYKRDASGGPTNVLASEAEVLADFRAVKATGLTNTSARNFKKFTKSELRIRDVSRLRDDDIDDKIAAILRNRRDLLNYLTYPLEAQLAILDLAFNRGINSVTRATLFVDAVRNRDWKRAAQMSNSVGSITSSTRQRKIETLLRNAADKEPFFTDSKCPRKSIVDFRM